MREIMDARWQQPSDNQSLKEMKNGAKGGQQMVNVKSSALGNRL
jgi:hypothetical protein